MRAWGCLLLGVTLGAVELRSGLSTGLTKLELTDERSSRAFAPAVRVHVLWDVLTIGSVATQVGVAGEAGVVVAVEENERRFVAAQAALGPALGWAVPIADTRLVVAGWYMGGYARQHGEGPWRAATGQGYQDAYGGEAIWLLPISARVSLGPRIAWGRKRLPEGVELEERKLGIEVSWRSSP